MKAKNIVIESLSSGMPMQLDSEAASLVNIQDQVRDESGVATYDAQKQAVLSNVFTPAHRVQKSLAVENTSPFDRRQKQSSYKTHLEKKMMRQSLGLGLAPLLGMDNKDKVTDLFDSVQSLQSHTTKNQGTSKKLRPLRESSAIRLKREKRMLDSINNPMYQDPLLQLTDRSMGANIGEKINSIDTACGSGSLANQTNFFVNRPVGDSDEFTHNIRGSRKFYRGKSLYQKDSFFHKRESVKRRKGKNVFVNKSIEDNGGHQISNINGHEESQFSQNPLHLSLSLMNQKISRKTMNKQEFHEMKNTSKKLEKFAMKLQDGEETTQIDNLNTDRFTDGSQNVTKNDNMTNPIININTPDNMQGPSWYSHSKSISTYDAQYGQQIEVTTPYDRSVVLSQQNQFRDKDIKTTFVYKKQLKRLQKELDSMEIDHQNSLEIQRPMSNQSMLSDEHRKEKRDLSKNGQSCNISSQNELKAQSLHHHMEIYLTSMKDLLEVLPSNQKTLQIVLARVADGFQKSLQQYQKQFDLQFREIAQIKMKSSKEINKLTVQFNEFKIKNNLDEYFKKYLSDDTRKKTLALVDELMVEEDWMEKLRDYKAYLDKLQYSDTEANLQSFHDDLVQAQKGRLKIFAEQTDQAEQTVEENLGNPPLPVQVFNTEFQATLDQNYNQGIQQTGKKVVERLLRHFVRPTKEVETQTESIKQLTLQYETKIEELENDIGMMREEYDRANKNSNTLNGKLRELNGKCRTQAQELNQLSDEYDKLKKELVEMKGIEFKVRLEMTDIRRVSQGHKDALMKEKGLVVELQLKIAMLKKENKDKNQTVVTIREDAKENAILKIKLTKKVLMQDMIIGQLRNQVKTLMEKIAEHAPDVDIEVEEIDFDVKSQSVHADELGGQYDEPLPAPSTQSSRAPTASPQSAVMLKAPAPIEKPKAPPTPKARPEPEKPKPQSTPKKKTAAKPSPKPSPPKKQPSPSPKKVVSPMVIKEEEKESPSVEPERPKTPPKKDLGVQPIPIQESQTEHSVSQENTIKVVQREPSPPRRKPVQVNTDVIVPPKESPKKVKEPKKEVKKKESPKKIKKELVQEESVSPLPQITKPKMIQEPPKKPDSVISAKVETRAKSSQGHVTPESPLKLNRNAIYDQSRPILPPVKKDNSVSQTDPVNYINFACEMFLLEIQAAIDDELNQNQDNIFYDLLAKAEYIIQRIKSKAISPYGAVSNVMGLPSVTLSKPNSPSKKKQETQKSWHFDTGREEQQNQRSPKTKREFQKSNSPIKQGPTSSKKTKVMSMKMDQRIDTISGNCFNGQISDRQGNQRSALTDNKSTTVNNQNQHSTVISDSQVQNNDIMSGGFSSMQDNTDELQNLATRVARRFVPGLSQQNYMPVSPTSVNFHQPHNIQLITHGFPLAGPPPTKMIQFGQQQLTTGSSEDPLQQASSQHRNIHTAAVMKQRYKNNQ